MTTKIVQNENGKDYDVVISSSANSDKEIRYSQINLTNAFRCQEQKKCDETTDPSKWKENPPNGVYKMVFDLWNNDGDGGCPTDYKDASCEIQITNIKFTPQDVNNPDSMWYIADSSINPSLCTKLLSTHNQVKENYSTYDDTNDDTNDDSDNNGSCNIGNNIFTILLILLVFVLIGCIIYKLCKKN